MPSMSFEDDEASYVARIARVRAREFPEAEPRSIFARCVAAALADNPRREHVAWG